MILLKAQSFDNRFFKKIFKEIFMVFGYFDGHEKCFQTGPGVLLTQMNKTCQKSIIDWTTRGTVTTVLIFTYCIFGFMVRHKTVLNCTFLVIHIAQSKLNP